MSKKQAWVSLVLNSLIVLVTTWVVISYFIFPGKIIKNGFESFRFFTTDSNILSAIAALVVVIFDIKILRGKIRSLTHAVEVFKFIGTTAVMLTFCTVVFFLIPIYGPALQLLGTAFHMHVGGPMMALLSFSIVEKNTRISIPEALLGLLPMAVYGAVYFTEVVLIGEQNGGWMDFYAFNRNNNWPITIIVMLTATTAISFLVRLLHNVKIKKAAA